MDERVEHGALEAGLRVARPAFRGWHGFWLSALVLTFASGTARATPRPGAKWPNGSFSFQVQTATFGTNLKGLSLTGEQTRYWVAYALSAWRERTGIQNGLQFSYGTTTAPQNCDGNPHVFNGSNQVAVSPGCAPDNPDCSVKGKNYGVCTQNCTVRTEADVCIYGGSASAWRVRFNSASSDLDLIQILRHEFGHALGLGHDTEAGSLMSDGKQMSGIRELSGNDIKGMRMMYPASSPAVARWREITGTGTTWSAETQVPTVDGVWGVSAAVGRSGSAQKVIVTELSDAGTVIHFNRASYPLTPTSTWDATFTTLSTWRPVAIAARPLTDPAGERWVAALVRAEDRTTACPKVRVLRSSDAFSSSSAVELDPCNNASELQLTYDPVSGRFILVMSSGTTGAIRVFTSTDGATWPVSSMGSATPIALEGVDVACAAGSVSNCVMTFATGDTNLPRLRNQQFSIATSTGAITLGSAANDTVQLIDGIPAAGVRTVSQAPSWMLALPTASGNSTDRSHGTHFVLTAMRSSIPFTSFSWGLVGTGTTFDHHRPDLASVPSSSRIYVWYVQ